MALQLGGLELKVPLSMLLVGGATLGPLQLPALGLTGCGIATATVMWCQLVGGITVLRRDPFYARFDFWRHGFDAPRRDAIAALLRLGVPIGLSTLVEVSGFTFMAFFIARLGPTQLAGHQIAANLVAMLFMLPLGLANATSTLVAQRIGAADLRDARRIGWHGLQVAGLIAATLGLTVFGLRRQVVGLYTPDPVIVAAALPLVAWVALFHLGDALQCLSSFVLRAWHVATVPVLIYALALWGLGLGGGYMLAFGGWALPAAFSHAAGFWAASTASLVVAALALGALLRWVVRQKLQHPQRP
jgi:MATE family multidrug resistance protein